MRAQRAARQALHIKAAIHRREAEAVRLRITETARGDVIAIRREATAVSEVSYLIRRSGQVQFGNQNWTTQIQGVSPNYPPLTNWRVEVGREITAEDEASAALVVVIGATVSRQLFGEGNVPIGALIQEQNLRAQFFGAVARALGVPALAAAE